MQPNPSVDVQVVPFKFKHYQQLLDMHASQKSPLTQVLTYRTLPKIGFIAFLGDQPIAAGFLRRLEPCYAQLDTLVSSAHFGSSVRNAGVSLVVDALIEQAKQLKLEGIIALTKDKSILMRAEGLGCHMVNESIVALSLL